MPLEYSQTIEINKPLAEVIEAYDSTENLKHWQPGLQEFTPISGEPGKTGSKSKMVFLNGKRTIEMVETITKNDLPRSLACTYEAKGVFNEIENSFREESGKTLLTSQNIFHFKGFMKLLGVLMPGAFKKQSMEYMNNFKAFVEDGKSVLSE